MKERIDFMAVCNIIATDPIITHFIARVTIPVGFCIAEPEDYGVFVTIDRGEINYNQLLVSKEATVIIEPERTITEDGSSIDIDAVTMQCDVQIREFKIAGPLYYNTIIKGFKPKEFLEIPDETVEPTAFSNHDTILVDEALGYACLDCELQEGIFTGTTVELTNTSPFVITETGTQVFYNEANPTEFFDALNNSESTQVILIPYTLTITPIAAPTVTP